MRNAPNTNGTVIANLARGTVLEALGRNGDWIRVRFNNLTGYVHRNYVILSTVAPPPPSPSPSPTPTPTPSPTPSPSPTPTPTPPPAFPYNRGVVNASALNFRTQPSMNAQVIRLLQRSTIVEPLAIVGDWVRVRHNNQVGYVSARYITLSNVTAATPPSAMAQAVVDLAHSQLGVPYRFGGASPHTGFDCSGLVFWIFGQLGRNLPRGSTSQLAAGTTIARNNLRPGDLVFFLDPAILTTGASHVGIYIGGGYMIHSPRPGGVVEIMTINRGYFDRYYLTARRIFT